MDVAPMEDSDAQKELLAWYGVARIPGDGV
jgi:hypothetical protein